jgi:hypothetical protein
VLRRGFTKRRNGVELRLDDVERTVLADLLDQLHRWIEPLGPTATEDPLAQLAGIPAETERPDDAALLRLFPDAYRDDEEAAADFRRFTEAGLRRERAERARRAAATLSRVASNGRIPLDEDEAQDWLRTLNDLRLVMGTRLGVTEEPEDLDAPDAERTVLYDWLTWLQSTLVDALLP